ncbi:MAG: 50S ribosomal protein L25/general stress protein Ctc [Holosporales bacterium]|nr:50S ribosomal protein L25/general stress protein Ctc [Holosporales bacterium]
MKVENVETDVLKANPRSTIGKGAARSLRRSGFIPCIVYGENKDVTMVSVSSKSSAALCARGDFFSRVVKLEIGDHSSIAVLPKDVQRHPVSGVPLHMDFQIVSKSHKIKLRVPVEFINADKSPAIKLGGVLNVVMPFVELLCPPLSIPQKFEIDLTGAGFGASFAVKDIAIPEGCSLSHAVHEDSVLANIVQPQRGGIEETAAVEAGAAATTPGTK